MYFAQFDDEYTAFVFFFAVPPNLQIFVCFLRLYAVKTIKRVHRGRRRHRHLLMCRLNQNHRRSPFDHAQCRVHLPSPLPTSSWLLTATAGAGMRDEVTPAKYCNLPGTRGYLALLTFVTTGKTMLRIVLQESPTMDGQFFSAPVFSPGSGGRNVFGFQPSKSYLVPGGSFRWSAADDNDTHTHKRTPLLHVLPLDHCCCAVWLIHCRCILPPCPGLLKPPPVFYRRCPFLSALSSCLSPATTNATDAGNRKTFDANLEFDWLPGDANWHMATGSLPTRPSAPR